MITIDKNYCMSSFLAYRYVVDDDKQFSWGLKHQVFKQISGSDKIKVNSAEDIDLAIRKTFSDIENKRKGILLSGGMDSAILASYMKGADAYTFRFMGGTYQSEELNRAERYAEHYGLHLHYVDVDWGIVMSNLDDVMSTKNAPVHSIEPQICAAAKQAKSDGIEIMVIGDGSDYVFGGMDKLLSKDWKFEEFYKRVIYVAPEEVLNHPVDMRKVLEPYREATDDILFLKVMDEIITDESYSSYQNAFKAAEMPYIDPYEKLIMKEPLDLSRIRAGESKYLIRQLFKIKYPDIQIPEKIPMPRPVDKYFAEWEGPKRPEFRKDINIEKFSGNQKWLIWCLERFLSTYC